MTSDKKMPVLNWHLTMLSDDGLTNGHMYVEAMPTRLSFGDNDDEVLWPELIKAMVHLKVLPEYVHTGWRRHKRQDIYSAPGTVCDDGWIFTSNLNIPEIEPQYKWEKVFTLKQEH